MTEADVTAVSPVEFAILGEKLMQIIRDQERVGKAVDSLAQSNRDQQAALTLALEKAATSIQATVNDALKAYALKADVDRADDAIKAMLAARDTRLAMIERIVYGLVSFILLGFAGAIGTIVFVKPAIGA